MIVVAAVVSMFLASCNGVSTHIKSDVIGKDGIACAGAIMEPPPGLEEVKNEALLAGSLGASGEGKLCSGKVFKVTYPLTVYRVWDNSKSYTAYGSWWSFSPPQGPRDSYREENDICPSWSALDRMSACTLKIGALIVIGPGQSADCTGTSYPKSSVNQVFMPNNSRNGQIFVDNCINSEHWPTVTQ
jgi:hypothetical protein